MSEHIAGQYVTLRGRVYIQQWRDGRVHDCRYINNTIVLVGLQWLSGALTGDTATPTDMKYIELGTSTASVTTADTTLGAAVGTRATGTQSRVTTTVTSDTYQAVGTVSITDTWAVTECGLFSANSAGSMMARQTFAALNVVSGDTVQITWQIAIA